MLRLAFFLCLTGAALALACNTAQVREQAPRDSGPVCEDDPPLVSCAVADAGELGGCSGGDNLALYSNVKPDASATIPPGFYAPRCTVQFLVTDPSTGTCAPAEPCTCTLADAGADADGAAAGPSTWQCIPQFQ